MFRHAYVIANTADTFHPVEHRAGIATLLGDVDVLEAVRAARDDLQDGRVGFREAAVRFARPLHRRARAGALGEARRSTGEPWLPIGPHETCNVEDEERDPGSMLTLVRRLLALRRSEPALAIGAIERVHAEGNVLVYDRTSGSRRLPCDRARFVMSTAMCEREPAIVETLQLEPNEGVILLVDEQPPVFEAG